MQGQPCSCGPVLYLKIAPRQAKSGLVFLLLLSLEQATGDDAGGGFLVGFAAGCKQLRFY